MVEERHTSFAVARLIMMSGVQLRKYGETTVDDPDDIHRLAVAVRSVLPSDAPELERELVAT
jgi:hypothetical protein